MNDTIKTELIIDEIQIGEFIYGIGCQVEVDPIYKEVHRIAGEKIIVTIETDLGFFRMIPSKAALEEIETKIDNHLMDLGEGDVIDLLKNA